MREGVKRKASPQGYGSVNKVRRVGQHFFRIPRGKVVSRLFCTSKSVASFGPKDTRQSRRKGLKYPVLLRGNLESEQGQLQKRARSHPQRKAPALLCLSSRNRSFLPKPPVEAAGDPARSALPSLPSGQVYSYHLPVNTKRWVEVLQDLHYTESFLGTQRHV